MNLSINYECNFCFSSVTTYLLGPNFLLETIFSKHPQYTLQGVGAKVLIRSLLIFNTYLKCGSQSAYYFIRLDQGTCPITDVRTSLSLFSTQFIVFKSFKVSGEVLTYS
jgi:hypothetical protein